MNCPNCQTPYEGDSRFCSACGTERPAEAVEATVAVNDQPAYGYDPYAAAPEAAAAPAKKFDVKKIAILAGAAVVLIVAIVFVFSLFGSKGNWQVYFDGTDSYLINTKNGETMPLDEDFAGGAILSADGKRMFYATQDNGKTDVYYVDPAKVEDGEATKIASGIGQFALTTNGKQGAYTKGDKLYRTDMKDSEQIAKKVDHFSLSADAKWLLYKTTEQNLYLQKKGNDPEKVASKVYDYTTAQDDYDTIIYLKDYTEEKGGKLYIYENGESAKVANDVTDFFGVTKKSTFYYTAVKDGKTVLYYYDGTEATKITDKYSGWEDCYTDDKTPRLVYTTAKESGEETVYETFVIVGSGEPMSIGKDVYTAYFNKKGDKLIYTVEKSTDEKTTYTVNEVKVNKDSLGEAEEIVSESFKKEENKYKSISAGYLDGKTAYYYIQETKTETYESTYEFYVDGALILDNVNSLWFDETVDGKTMLITTDYKAAKKEGESSTYTLWKYKIGAKEAEKVADDVTDACFDGGNKVLYVQDDALYLNDEKISDDAESVGGMMYLAGYEDSIWTFGSYLD